MCPSRLIALPGCSLVSRLIIPSPENGVHRLDTVQNPVEVATINIMISVIILCFNECQHIETCVRSILSQERPLGGLEIIVVDGLSDDGTREILTRLASEHPELCVVDNPRRITPCAMNAGIQAARGKYFAILGANTQYAADFLMACASLLHEHPEVSCVGGPAVTRGKGLFGQAVAAAMTHPVGIGNAKHRHPSYEGSAEMACYPVFGKEVFERIGLYRAL
jgi:glycosyltransferase involved in cell wall biosynthesis